MRHKETYVVDLNNVLDNHYISISRRHTREFGRGVLVDPLADIGIQEGDHVTIYSGDERMYWEALVVKAIGDERYAVDVFWDSGTATPDASQAMFVGTSSFGPAHTVTVASEPVG